MSAYAMFNTDKDLETTGFWLDFGGFQVLIARAGGSNVKFAKIVEEKTRPYRRAVELGTMDAKVAEKIMVEVYAESIILGWKVQRDEKWQEGIDAPDGGVLPVTKENIIGILTDLPELFTMIRNEAEKVANFKKASAEAEAKNS